MLKNNLVFVFCMQQKNSNAGKSGGGFSSIWGNPPAFVY